MDIKGPELKIDLPRLIATLKNGGSMERHEGLYLAGVLQEYIDATKSFRKFHVEQYGNDSDKLRMAKEMAAYLLDYLTKKCSAREMSGIYSYIAGVNKPRNKHFQEFMGQVRPENGNNKKVITPYD